MELLLAKPLRVEKGAHAIIMYINIWPCLTALEALSGPWCRTGV